MKMGDNAVEEVEVIPEWFHWFRYCFGVKLSKRKSHRKFMAELPEKHT